MYRRSMNPLVRALSDLVLTQAEKKLRDDREELDLLKRVINLGSEQDKRLYDEYLEKTGRLSELKKLLVERKDEEDLGVIDAEFVEDAYGE